MQSYSASQDQFSNVRTGQAGANSLVNGCPSSASAPFRSTNRSSQPGVAFTPPVPLPAVHIGVGRAVLPAAATTVTPSGSNRLLSSGDTGHENTEPRETPISAVVNSSQHRVSALQTENEREGSPVDANMPHAKEPSLAEHDLRVASVIRQIVKAREDLSMIIAGQAQIIEILKKQHNDRLKYGEKTHELLQAILRQEAGGKEAHIVCFGYMRLQNP